MISDSQLLRTYLQGFKDELGCVYLQGIVFSTDLEEIAYKLGSIHALVGDDVKSVDNLTLEEILKLIKGNTDDKK